MNSFYGKQSVKETHAKQPKKRNRTLNKRTSGDTFATGVTFSTYKYPVSQASGLGSDGSATDSTTIVLYRLGQLVGPTVEDTITDTDGALWLIYNVNTRLDDDANYAVYDCSVYKMS